MADEVLSVAAERGRLQHEIRSLITTHIVEQARTKGAEDIIRNYARAYTYLRFLNDLPVKLGIYGQAVKTILAIEHDRGVPDNTLISPEHMEEHAESLCPMLEQAFTEKRPILWIGEALQASYRKYAAEPVWEWDWQNMQTKAQVLIGYALLFKSEIFATVIKQPVKDRILALVEDLDNVIGPGLTVHPGSDAVARQTDHPRIEEFLCVSGIGEKELQDSLPEELKQKLAPLRAALAALPDA